MKELKKIGELLTKIELKDINGGTGIGGDCLTEMSLCVSGGRHHCCEGLFCETGASHWGLCKKKTS